MLALVGKFSHTTEVGYPSNGESFQTRDHKLAKQTKYQKDADEN